MRLGTAVFVPGPRAAPRSMRPTRSSPAVQSRAAEGQRALDGFGPPDRAVAPVAGTAARPRADQDGQPGSTGRVVEVVRRGGGPDRAAPGDAVAEPLATGPRDDQPGARVETCEQQVAERREASRDAGIGVGGHPHDTGAVPHEDTGLTIPGELPPASSGQWRRLGNAVGVLAPGEHPRRREHVVDRQSDGREGLVRRVAPRGGPDGLRAGGRSPECRSGRRHHDSQHDPAEPDRCGHSVTRRRRRDGTRSPGAARAPR